jgi:hypothetical protein
MATALRTTCIPKAPVGQVDERQQHREKLDKILEQNKSDIL